MKLKPLGGEIWTKPFKVLLLLAVVAGIFIIRRFVFGLGAVTNLNDGYPWGMWIVYDVVTGTAIACGGYAMAILVYIFNRGKYHPMVRSALLASLFGYTLAGASILLDVGRYWQLQNVFLPGYYNPNSVMFEVASCIALYVFVMWVEFAPAFAEQQKKEKLHNFLNKIMFIFLGLGVLLPTMHQSSLGSLLIVAGEKLSPLFQTMWIPLLFLLTAVLMGYSMVIVESILSSVGFKRPVETTMLGRLSRLIPFLLVIFLIIRFADIIIRGEIGLLFSFNLASIMFIIETILFVIPMVILFSEKNRGRSQMLFISAVLMILAGGLYRFDAFIVVFNPGHGYHYFPAFQEIMITLGIIAVEIMGYLIFVKRLPVLPEVKHA